METTTKKKKVAKFRKYLNVTGLLFPPLLSFRFLSLRNQRKDIMLWYHERKVIKIDIVTQ